MSKTFTEELPPNYKELKESTNRMADWEERLVAVEELGAWKHDRVIDILKHKMINDPVFKIQEAAYKNLVNFGEDVELPSQKKGDLLKDASKVFVRIKKSLPKGHTFEQYEDKLKNMRLDLYNTYQGEKGGGFDDWLKETWENATKK